MSRKVFWIAPVAFVGLISVGFSPAEAATKAAAKTRAASKTARATAYSAERSRSRKLTLARARAAAMAREMADTALPRYKVDAGGDLVPDIHAAAAIIYNPETNQVLWEENSQSQRSIASITKSSPSRDPTSSRRRRRTCTRTTR